MAGLSRGLTAQDRWQIADLLSACAFASDSGDVAVLDDVFVPDATASFLRESSRPGLDGIKAVFLELFERLDAMQHTVNTSLVTATPAGAHVRSYFVAWHVRHGAPGGDVYAVGGTYEDDVVRRDGGWRLAHRSIERSWSEGNPAVLDPHR